MFGLKKKKNRQKLCFELIQWFVCQTDTLMGLDGLEVVQPLVKRLTEMSVGKPPAPPSFHLFSFLAQNNKTIKTIHGEKHFRKI